MSAQSALATLATLLAVSASLIGCGGEQRGVARIDGVADSAIDRGTLDHWMQALVGLDYRQTVGTRGPRGLVAEPADYPRCVAAARSIASSRSGAAPLSDEQVSAKCHELYLAVKAQALDFLISAHWTIAEAAEQGIRVSGAELRREFTRFRKRPYPTERALHAYLSERQWTLSDMLYEVKQGILVRRLLPSFERKVKQAGGGEKVYARLASVRFKALIAKTSCEPRYVVPNCREYHGFPAPRPPNVILEGLVRGSAT